MAIIEHVYAELLINVRIITLFVHVSYYASKEEISVALEDDGASVMLSCQNKNVHLLLPAKASPGVPGHAGDLRLLPADGQEKSVRLSLDSGSHQSRDAVQEAVPWSASDLRNMECAHCRKCRRDILRPGVINSWKDLPSENWAEMMDFWHCHKPDETTRATDTNKAQEQKGYSAANKLSAQAGTAFVDTSHFLVAREDCSNITTVDNAKSNEARDQDQYLQCDACRNVLGVVDPHANGWKLFKWSLALGLTGYTQLDVLKLECCISDRLLSSSEAQSTRKILIHSDLASRPTIIIWIFTPDYWLNHWSAGDATVYQPQRAMKVLWKPAEPMSPQPSHSVESLHLPSDAFDELSDALNSNANVLPASTSKHQDWNVSFLKRHAP